MPRFKIGMWIALPAALVLAAGPACAASGWTTAPIPPTGQNGYLLGVSADSDTDAWTVGTVNRAEGFGPGPLIDHWNGSSWAQSATPSFASNLTVSLDSVSASGTSDAWASHIRCGWHSPNGILASVAQWWGVTSVGKRRQCGSFRSGHGR